ncbi:hypothetical protein PVAND_011145 [Polypedilum vanderplanki]|uniref:Ribonuclease P/MRP protein subunit POP5 n=1 Tax=Polypedilum vanderplanki TaxID=319348 RepID=A0A9J6CIL5_POLVA|nr:hypothetical protein PVAND_011145 [Polypedilum vanderplanki]
MVRFKNRYVLLEIKSISKATVSSKELADTLRKATKKYYGDYGLASVSNLNVKLFYDKHKLAIIRVTHGPHKFITSIIPLLKTAGKELATYRILYIGATIRQCKKFIINHQNDVLRKVFSQLSTENERKNLIEDLTKSLEI